MHKPKHFQTIYLYVCHLNNISRLRYVILRTKVISKDRGNEMFCCWCVVWYGFKVLNYTTIQPPHLSRKCTSVQTRPIPFSPHYMLRYWIVLNFCWVYSILFYFMYTCVKNISIRKNTLYFVHKDIILVSYFFVLFMSSRYNQGFLSIL